MLKLIKSSSLRLAVGAFAGLIVATVTGGATVTSSNVTIMTPPTGTETLVIDGVQVGAYPVYDGRARTTFSWTRYWPLYWPDYPNPKPATQGYKVSVWQNTTPLAAAPTWNEMHISHHRIDDANPTRFTFDTFLDTEKLCETCPSVIVVQAETIQVNPEGSGDGPYSTIPAIAPNSSGVPAIMKSDTILFKGYTRLQDTRCDLPNELKWMCAFF